MSPLHFAVNQGNKKVTEALVRSGANLMVRNWVGDTALELACNSKTATLDLLRYLLKQDAYSANQQSPWCGPSIIYYFVVGTSKLQTLIVGNEASSFAKTFSKSTWHR